MTINKESVSRNNQLIAKNTMLLTIRMVVVLAIGLYTSRVILQVLGVEDYGIYNVVGGFVTMFAFINTSMNNGIQRYYNFELGKNGVEGARKVYHCALVTQITIAIIVTIAIETFGLWYLHNKLVIPPDRFDAARYIFQFSVVSILFTVINVPYSAAITAHEKMDYYAIVSIVDVFLKLIIVLVLPLFNADSLIVYGFLIIIISALDFLLYYIYAKNHFLELKGRIVVDRELLKNMLSFSGWNLFGSFGGVMKEQGLNLLLNAFFGPVVNAARGIAYQVLNGVQSFIGNITTASRPQLTQSYAQGNLRRTFNIMYSMSKMCYISVFIFALPVMLEAESLLHLWLGANVPEHTSAFVVLIVGASLIHVFTPPTSFVVHATGKMRKYQTITTLFSLFLLPVAYVFLKHGSSAEIVFVLYFIFMLLGQGLCLIILRSIVEFSIREYIEQVIWPCFLLSIAACALPIGLHIIMAQSYLRLFVVSVVGGICVIVSSFYLGMNVSERSLITDFIKKKISK